MISPQKNILLFPEIRVTKIFLLFNRFSVDILFPSLVSFTFFCILLFFLLFTCFLKLKIYIPIHIRLRRRVSDKNFFTRPISRKKTTFFFLALTISTVTLHYQLLKFFSVVYYVFVSLLIVNNILCYVFLTVIYFALLSIGRILAQWVY